MKLSTTLTSMTLMASSAFALVPNSRLSFKTQTVGEFQPSLVAKKTITPVAIVTAATVASPLIASAAEQVDDYEYGAVDAPIGIAVGGGILAILTALLPIALRGGEEAFEEMKEKDSGSWGTGNRDRLSGRK